MQKPHFYLIITFLSPQNVIPFGSKVLVENWNSRGSFASLYRANRPSDIKSHEYLTIRPCLSRKTSFHIIILFFSSIKRAFNRPRPSRRNFYRGFSNQPASIF